MTFLAEANYKEKKDKGGGAISVVILTTTPLVSGSDAYVIIGGIIHRAFRV